jgi:hypothetical protein
MKVVLSLKQAVDAYSCHQNLLKLLIWKSDLYFHFSRLFATLVNVIVASPYYNSHFMFRPNWPSSSVQVMRLRWLLFRFFLL